MKEYKNAVLKKAVEQIREKALDVCLVKMAESWKQQHEGEVCVYAEEVGGNYTCEQHERRV